MISKTFLKETKELLREGRVRIAFVVVILLLGVSVWISARQYENVNQQYEIAKTARGNHGSHCPGHSWSLPRC